MYTAYFGLSERPFSIAPNPRFLFMSPRHREALAHLLYGISEGGGFVQLTGEVGTGKTTVCRCLLEQLPADVDVALILNPRLSAAGLVTAICDELEIDYTSGGQKSLKEVVDLLNAALLERHARGRRTVLIIDEAQNLAADVLEQVRLLTNLETDREKLLRIILIGQPELKRLLSQVNLRQLAQRITARYHLEALSFDETAMYIRYRLAVAGQRRKLFTRPALWRIYRASHGIPRLINVICDRALTGAYAADRTRVGYRLAGRAAAEVQGREQRSWAGRLGLALTATLLVALLVGIWRFAGPADLDSMVAAVQGQGERWSAMARGMFGETGDGARVPVDGPNGNGDTGS